jgi:hypothetical protein
MGNEGRYTKRSAIAQSSQEVNISRKEGLSSRHLTNLRPPKFKRIQLPVRSGEQTPLFDSVVVQSGCAAVRTRHHGACLARISLVPRDI